MFTRTRRVFAIVLIALLSSSSVFAQIADTVRFGAISIAYVARNSNAGKAALAQIEALGRKKSIEVEARAAELQKQQVELQKQGSVMSPRAITDLQRAFDKSRLEFDRFQQDAQADKKRLSIAGFDPRHDVLLGNQDADQPVRGIAGR